MANLSQVKREKLLNFLAQLKEKVENDNDRITINEIETELLAKRYGLVWEKHEEQVDVDMRDNVLVFKEVADKEIHSDLESNSYNFLLEGDNLHSLKLLEKTHRGQIDVIYIDPPYNRGKNDFRYDDAYINPDDEFKHSKWLSFMSERLLLAKQLLSNEGVIFISIDDNEQAPLKLLCDEVFGNDNFLGIIIQNKQNSKNDTINIQKNHEYIIAYRRKSILVGTKVKPTLLNGKVVTKKIFVENGEYYYLNDAITTRGEGGTLKNRRNLGYTVYYNPETNDKIGIADYDVELTQTSNDEAEVYTTREDMIQQGYIPVRPPRVRGCLGCWTWELSKFNKDKHNIVVLKSSRGENYIVKKRTFVSPDDVYEEKGSLYIDLYSEGNSRSIIDFSTNDGTTELTNVLGVSGQFDNPKNVDMIKYLLSLYPNKKAIVLDFFAGSGTTGQAVLELNKADRGTRKFILCTNNQNDICEQVTYVRVKNRIEGYKFVGKKVETLFTKKIDFSVLEESDALLLSIEEIVMNAQEQYDEVEKIIKDGVITVSGIEYTEDSIEGIPANLKYYKTDKIPKTSEDEDYLVTDKLLDYIRELVQLENHIDLSNSPYILLLTDEDADELENHPERLEGCLGVYKSTDVLLSSSLMKLLKGVSIHDIPTYYYEDELREVHELW